MRRVRDVTMAADPRITALVKYGTVTFACGQDLAGYVQVADKKRVSLMFNNGAKIAGRYPHLEGSGPNARFMRFVDLAEVNARAPELRRIVKAWCAMPANSTTRGEG
jgi:hypothetical protein